MYSEQSVPYFLKLPPYNLTEMLGRLTTFGLFVLLLVLGTVMGFFLISFFHVKESLAGVLFFLCIALPWIFLVIDEIYFRPKRPYWKYNLYTKWCYVPSVKKESGMSKKAWIRNNEQRVIIEQPGFYFLKPGYHVMFVGTLEEWESYLDMAMNGGL